MPLSSSPAPPPPTCRAGACATPPSSSAGGALETFFTTFDRLTDAHTAVEKLRELVLQLAVQGKLVDQNESDGHASDIFTNKSDRTKKPAVIEADERYEVPTSWMWIRFAAVGEQRLGKMLDQKGNRGDLKPYLRNTNV